MKKKIFSAVLSAMLALSLCPAIALADTGDTETADTGTNIGEDVASEEATVDASTDIQVLADAPVTPLAEGDIASGELGTCTWTIDSNGCLTIAPADGVSGEFEMTRPSYNSWPWYNNRVSICSVKVESGVSASGSLDYMFYALTYLTSIDLSALNTSNVTSMYSMFYDCTSLTSLNLSGLDMSNVTNMHTMFSICSSLTSLNLSGLDMSNVTNMNQMFSDCTSLTSLNLSGLDVSNVIDMYSMFYNCKLLTSLDLSSFNTSNVKFMDSMFGGCSSLTSLNVSGFDTSNVTDMASMFSGCSSLTSLDVSNFDTSNVTNMSYMFGGCSSLTSLDVSGFDTSNVTNMFQMFYNCSSLASLDLSNFVTSIETNMGNFFNGCTSLYQVKLAESFVFSEWEYNLSGNFYNNYLPVPFKNGERGKWMSDDGIIYDDPSDIPSYKATTYTAVFPESKTTLEETIEEAEALNASDYTPDSWAALESALAKAKDVLANDNATQDEVDAATSALQNAIDALEHAAFTIVAQNTTLQVGDTETLTINAGGDTDANLYDWTSSNNSIVTVTSAGRIAAWSKGTATITATSKSDRASASIQITVVSNGRVMPVAMQTVSGGALTNTVSDNNYTTWSSPMYSAMYQSDSNTLVRVEYTNSEVLVEQWSTDAGLLSSKTLSCELPIYGGFYSGSDYNFLVFGQQNPNESDDCEVMRVVKYSKDWQRLGACSVYGANTYIPFDAGSLRMTETGSNLYIYTCHEMYDSDGSGLHHQANMTFVIDKSSMSVQQSYSGIMNISMGYVSHSFNQFVQADDTYLYRVDHGDSYPRAVSITRCSLDGSITKVSYTYALNILGTTGANATGVSVGGFELSTDNCIIAGNSVDQSNSATYSASAQRNIFVSITDKAFTDTNVVWLTNYTAEDGITPRTPQLVKLDDEHFLVMWEEVNSNTKETTTRVATINSEGVVTQNYSTRMRLSDCQPILTSDGYVRWYATDGTDVTLYSIDPYQLNMTCPASSFSDVSDPTEWYYDSVCYMNNLGIITGYNETTFGVGDPMTRAQLVTVMWRYCEPEEYANYNEAAAKNTSGLPDVPDGMYYTGAVNWAVANNVITGNLHVDGTYTFNPDDDISFDQMVTIMARYVLGFNAAENYNDSVLSNNRFTDGAAVEDWARGSMSWAIDNDVVTGNNNHDGTYTISPLESVARERAATVLARSIQAGLVTD